MISCTNKSERYIEEQHSLCADDLVIDESNIYGDMQYVNSVRGHKEQDSIVGKFIDNTIDTLWFECCDKENFRIWELCCSNKKVPRCKFWAVSPSLVMEGDLDGNGTDDFGFLDTWDCSDCRDYHVATIVNYKFTSMLCLHTAHSLRASGKDLVQKSNEKGCAHVVYSDMEAPMSCCSSAPDIDTLLRFEYQEFNQSYFE